VVDLCHDKLRERICIREVEQPHIFRIVVFGSSWSNKPKPAIVVASDPLDDLVARRSNIFIPAHHFLRVLAQYASARYLIKKFF
jgi:hypothetical protein